MMVSVSVLLNFKILQHTTFPTMRCNLEISSQIIEQEAADSNDSSNISKY